MAIESYQPVEARTVQEEKIQRTRLGIKAFAHGIIVIVAPRPQLFSFIREKGFRHGRGEISALNFLIEANDMDIRVGQKGLFLLDVEGLNARNAERFDPTLEDM